ncbi:MAG: ATP-binding protein [Candidatus Acididesulfobacter diazotrophicus]|jgi:magnesium chelatase family protein|uniref:ATP-binding protein n=1 Tax=Candidatus Acididesulfobacter diazotrophicus TaxID=2597226 RepID=A0A519BQK4_9DELT|nr:MAG: ATP-binding protein [Candidatus Acididesulfobacter diazotrophicus]
MITKLHSATFLGINAIIVDVEVFIANGIPGIMIVGLPDASTKESKDRVKAAIKNSSFEYPARKITINLAPADIKKSGPIFDLSLAIGILISAKLLIPKINLDDYIIAGELSLNGNINKIDGVIALSLLAKRLNKKIIIPYENLNEAKYLGIEYYCFNTLTEVCNFISVINKKQNLTINSNNDNNSGNILLSNEEQDSETISRQDLFYIENNSNSSNSNSNELIDNYKIINNSSNEIFNTNNYYPDFSDIKGHITVKRAMEIAVAGHHNILMIGSPGSGKTMIAQSAAGILPLLSLEEAIEITNIYSFSHKKINVKNGLITSRPFMQVHYSATIPALLGGGANPVPGDVSLAHNGVLFIDEFSEMNKKTLDSLRQPMEDKIINISRNRFLVSFPCDFMLIAAMNPCSCGYLGDQSHECRCSGADIYKFYNKLSGPILDRFDIFVEVYSESLNIISNNIPEESSYEVQRRINKATDIQNERFKNMGKKFNVSIKSSEIKKFINISEETFNFYKSAAESLKLSSRGYFRILKVARTISDIDGKDEVDEASILEALNYRNTKFLGV